jgi:hypothetical protein
MKNRSGAPGAETAVMQIILFLTALNSLGHWRLKILLAAAHLRVCLRLRLYLRL